MDALGDRLVLVAVSTPSYAHGVVDPVGPVAAEAAARGVRCHVDACIGGWVLPWSAHPDPWDFAVPGVTSLSADLHKYAYTPKGVSLLLHRDPALRRAQFFASADWPGYTMLNSTMQSTRSGGPLAAAWAVTRFIGVEGYRALVGTTLAATREVADAVRATAHLRLAAEPDASLLAVATDDALDVFTLADELSSRGWFVQPQMAFRDLPATLHLTLSAATAAGVDDLVVALRASVDAAVAAGPVVVAPELRAAAASLDPATLDDAAFDGLLALAGLGGEGTVAVPERMAPVNALLDAAPPRLREALLVAFLDRLTR
jgi:sphinganine-1-phosphate aldolase